MGLLQSLKKRRDAAKAILNDITELRLQTQFPLWKEVQAKFPIGKEFQYLGIVMIVVGFKTPEVYKPGIIEDVLISPRLFCEYADTDGVIHSFYFTYQMFGYLLELNTEG